MASESMPYEVRVNPELPPATYGKWLRTSANWTTTDQHHGFLLGKNGELVTVWFGDDLVSTGLSVPTFTPLSEVPSADERPYVVCNVVTAPIHRKRGLARQVLAKLVETCEQQGASELRLTSTPPGRPLYQSFGFVRDDLWSLDLIERATGASVLSIGRVVRADDRLLESAYELEAEAFERQDNSRLEMQEGCECYVIIEEGAVVGATWMRPLEPFSTTVRKSWIGPLVARNDELANELVQGALVLWKEKHVCDFVVGLAIPVGANGTAGKVFERNRFNRMRDVPLMRKPLRGALPALRAPGKLVYLMNGWFGS